MRLEDANNGKKTFTYQTRVRETSPLLNAFLSDYAALYGLVERKLFADVCRGNHILKLKNEYLTKFGITARQFNAIRIVLQGKIDSMKLRVPHCLQDKYGKHVTISKLQFQHGHTEILEAIGN